MVIILHISKIFYCLSYKIQELSIIQALFTSHEIVIIYYFNFFGLDFFESFCFNLFLNLLGVHKCSTSKNIVFFLFFFRWACDFSLIGLFSLLFHSLLFFFLLFNFCLFLFLLLFDYSEFILCRLYIFPLKLIVD